MKTITKNCLHCNSEFSASLKEHNRGNAKFCCRSCSSQFNGSKMKPQPNLNCSYCSTPIYRSISKKSLSKHGYHFCCRECKENAQRINNPKNIPAIMPNHYGDGRYSGNQYRKKALSQKEEIKCERCGYDDHPEVIEVHHRDRDRQNDDITNLELLCPTCHAVEHMLAGDGRWWRISESNRSG